jgi:hypothetical protein
MTATSIVEKIKSNSLLHRPEEEFVKARIIAWAIKQLLICPNNPVRQAHLEYILYLTAISNLNAAIEYIEKDEPDMSQFNYNTKKPYY